MTTFGGVNIKQVIYKSLQNLKNLTSLNILNETNSTLTSQRFICFARQACLQTGEDDVPEESQTDLIEYHDIWTQYPPDIGGAIGGN